MTTTIYAIVAITTDTMMQDEVLDDLRALVTDAAHGYVGDPDRALGGAEIAVSGSLPITDDAGAEFIPWVGDEGQVGYRVVMPDERVQFIYMNASTGSDVEGAPPCVFVYNDTTGSPDSGMTLHFYDLDEDLR